MIFIINKSKLKWHVFIISFVMVGRKIKKNIIREISQFHKKKKMG